MIIHEIFLRMLYIVISDIEIGYNYMNQLYITDTVNEFLRCYDIKLHFLDHLNLLLCCRVTFQFLQYNPTRKLKRILDRSVGGGGGQEDVKGEGDVNVNVEPLRIQLLK